MTAASTPPDILDRLRDLERQVKDLQRQQNPPPPSLASLADIAGDSPASGMTLEYDQATGTWRASEVIAPGDVKWTASNVAPSGRWLAADGSAVSRTTYAGLFDNIGTFFGAGNGTTTFNLPNLSGRFIIGVGTDGLGGTGGSRNAVVGSHTHTTGVHASGAEAAGFGLTASASFQDRVRVDGSGDVSGSTGSSVTNANLPPYVALYGYVRY
jgi:microcystin-dependent protein